MISQVPCCLFFVFLDGVLSLRRVPVQQRAPDELEAPEFSVDGKPQNVQWKVEDVEDDFPLIAMFSEHQQMMGLYEQWAAKPQLILSDFIALTQNLPKKEILHDIRWLHIPKCGSSFKAALLHLACPRIQSWDQFQPEDWYNKYPTKSDESKYCDHSLALCARGYTCHQAWGMLPIDDALKVAPVVMVRDPKKRIISAHFYDQKSTLIDSMVGCQTRMFLGSACYNVRNDQYSPPISEEQMSQAIKIMKKFAFVGLTDEWDVSMILLHAEFGGSLESFEFRNSRKGEYHGTQDVDKIKEKLGNWTDPYDGPLFQEATILFKQRLQERFGAACKKASQNTICQCLTPWFNLQ